MVARTVGLNAKFRRFQYRCLFIYGFFFVLHSSLRHFDAFVPQLCFHSHSTKQQNSISSQRPACFLLSTWLLCVGQQTMLVNPSCDFVISGWIRMATDLFRMLYFFVIHGRSGQGVTGLVRPKRKLSRLERICYLYFNCRHFSLLLG